MRIVRYEISSEKHYGLLQQDRTIRRLKASPFDSLETDGGVDQLESVTLLCPVERPRIFGVAYNYRDHTSESGKEQPTLPVVFMKPSTSATGPNQPIFFPYDGEIVHYEAELVAIIGREARYISRESALDYVLGYTCGNDVSDRVVQRQESKYGCLLAGKGYDSFAPMGPEIVTDLDPTNLEIRLTQNGTERQRGNTSCLVYSVAEIVSYLSRFMTLLPGDVIMTGTPAGVGPIAVGDVLEVSIDGIGKLINRVVAEQIPT